VRQSHSEQITQLKPDEVFVFGSNKCDGFHGAGAAGFASFGRHGNVWREEGYAEKPNGWKGKWNIKGIAEGYQEGTEGKSYALPTVWRAGQKRSLDKNTIIDSIKKLYCFANLHPELKFLVANSVTSKTPLCGYSNRELALMYIKAGPIPLNVIFSASYSAMIF